jgi:ribose transport system permease protein
MTTPGTGTAVAETGAEEIFSLGDRVRTRASAVLSEAAAAGAVVVLFIVLSIMSPVFLSKTNMFNLGVQISITAVLAVGMTFVIITAGIDLSVGANAGFAGIIGAKLIAEMGMPDLVGVLGGVAIGGLVGLVNGLLIAWARLASFITTLGMQSVLRGAVFVVTNALPIPLAVGFAWLGSGSTGGIGIPVPVVFVLLIAVAAHLTLTRTKFGRYVYALGSNPEAARLSGISEKRYLPLVYVICGCAAGFAGMLATSQTISGQPTFGVGIELDAIAAAVIGGASLFGGEGRVSGALIGAVLIGLVRNGSVLLDINQYWQSVILGLLIWVAVLFDQARRRRLAAVG